MVNKTNLQLNTEHIIPKLAMYLSKYISTSQFNINLPFLPNSWFGHMFYSFDYNPNILYTWKHKSSLGNLRDSKQINSKISPNLG